ncbi:SHC SH2 domain-binding protein 1 [Protopterus annectens]|uniref:SHC SH2 domain-binding protein 1 n=1 Tax=Protopterus annectens TaxID=7888 RepID=UPI001CFA2D36|nr:SHC SH2 domain-binding protein 1 [Protopterus annectens]
MRETECEAVCEQVALKAGAVELMQETDTALSIENVRLHDGIDGLRHGLFQNDDYDDKDAESSDDDDNSDYGSHDKPGTSLPRLIQNGNVPFPDIFQTNQLLFYERFKAYQDYILGDCKTSEVREFIAEYLENVLEPNGWQAIWRTDVFEVLVEVTDVTCSSLKAVVRVVEPFLCESKVCAFTVEAMNSLLEAKDYLVPLQELFVVFEESGEFDQTAMAVEHVRFFYQNIWRCWDEEDEDDFDYFVRSVEPRLRLYYDIVEDRVPSGLVVEYHGVLLQCENKYKEFLSLRNSIAESDLDTESGNVSMVEGLKLYEEIESLKRKLRLIENPLLRYVLGYQAVSRPRAHKVKGFRPEGGTVIHIVSRSLNVSLLQSLMRDKLYPESSKEDLEIQFHSDPLIALNMCYEGDTVVICPGHYSIDGFFSIADSIELEDYGLLTNFLLVQPGKGDISFVDCTVCCSKIANVKLLHYIGTEGLLCVRQGKTSMENCVFQCETTGVTVRPSAELFMKNCDLYGAKGAGVEIYPGSTCQLIGNGIHHCREGILIKDFIDEMCKIPKITMVNNVIHNNEGYGVTLVKPVNSSEIKEKMPSKCKDAGTSYTNTEERDQLCQETCNKVCVVDINTQSSSNDSNPSEQIECNTIIINELVATSVRKTQIYRKRLSELGITEANDDLMSDEMFVSIAGNQFKYNGKGSFGIFFL